MKKTLLLSATAAILAGAFAPAVFADTTSGSTAAASSTPAQYQVHLERLKLMALFQQIM